MCRQPETTTIGANDNRPLVTTIDENGRDYTAYCQSRLMANGTIRIERLMTTEPDNVKA